MVDTNLAILITWEYVVNLPSLKPSFHECVRNTELYYSHDNLPVDGTLQPGKSILRCVLLMYVFVAFVAIPFQNKRRWLSNAPRLWLKVVMRSGWLSASLTLVGWQRCNSSSPTPILAVLLAMCPFRFSSHSLRKKPTWLNKSKWPWMLSRPNLLLECLLLTSLDSVETIVKVSHMKATIKTNLRGHLFGRLAFSTFWICRL